MSDVSLYTNRSSYASEINSFDNNQDVAHKEQQSEVEQAGLDVVSQVETQPTNNDVTSEPAKAAPLIQPSTSTNVDAAQAADSAKVADGMQEVDGAQASEGKSDGISDETKANLSSYLSKSCDMYVSHNSQARDNAADMNALLKGVATNPLDKISLSDGLQEQVNNAVAQKSVGTLPGGEKVLNAQHNLEAFFQIAQGADSTVRATCGANSISYVANLMASMSNSKECSAVCSKFMEAAFLYLACENAEEAKKLQGKLEQAMAELQTLAQSGSAQDQGLASVISNFTNELISQKNDSFVILNQTSMRCGKVDIIDAQGFFELEQGSIVSPALNKLESLGGIANSNFDNHINIELNSIVNRANRAIDLITNNKLDKAHSDLSYVGVRNKEAQALLQDIYDQQIETQAARLANHILTPKSERQANANANTNDPFDISKFNGEHSADLYALYKDLSAISAQEGDRFNKLALLLDNTSGNTKVRLSKQNRSPATINQDVFNKTVTKLKEALITHEGFDAKSKQHLQNIEANIASLQAQIDNLKPDEDAVWEEFVKSSGSDAFIDADSIKYQALERMAEHKATINHEIDNCYAMMATVLGQGIEQYVNNNLAAEELAKLTLIDYGINVNTPFGGINGGVTGLLNASELANKPKDAAVLILDKVVDEITGNSKKALEAKKYQQFMSRYVANQDNANSNVADALCKDLLRELSRVAIESLKNSTDVNSQKLAYNHGRRIIGSFAALKDGFADIAHAIGMANHKERYATLAEQNAATPSSDTTQDTQSPAVAAQEFNSASAAADEVHNGATAASAQTQSLAGAEDAQGMGANEQMVKTEITELFDLIAQEDNTKLCEQILATAFVAQDNNTVSNLINLLESVEHGYLHDKELANRMVNTKTMLKKLEALNSNAIFKELQNANSNINKLETPAISELKSAYAKMVAGASVDNILQLAIAISHVQKQDIVLNPNDFMAAAQAKFDELSSSNDNNVAIPSVEQIAQELCNNKTNQLLRGLSLLQNNGDFLVDMAYAQFQLNKNILISDRMLNQENQEFFNIIKGSSDNQEDVNYLLDFMQNGLFRSNDPVYKALNEGAYEAVDKVRVPTAKTFAKNINTALYLNQERTNVAGRYIDTYATDDEKAAIDKNSGISLAKRNEQYDQYMAKQCGSDINFLTIGMSKGLEANLRIKVDDKSSNHDFCLYKAGVSDDQVDCYLSPTAKAKDQGETQAAAIRLLLSLVSDEDFTGVNITDDIVAMYLATKPSGDQQSIPQPLTAREHNILMALEVARHGSQAVADSSNLIRALYREYQSANDHLKGKDFNQLSQDDYQAMLTHYYGILGNSVPNDLSICGPRSNSKALSHDEKIEVLKSLSKAINKNELQLPPAIKQHLNEKLDIILTKNQNSKALKDAFAAIHVCLSNNPTLLKVCDYVMLNKSVANSVKKKDPLTTSETQDRMLSKLFGKNQLGINVASQFAFIAVQQNYLNSNDLKTKSFMIKQGEKEQFNAIKADAKSKALYETLLHNALLDVVELYDNDSIRSFVTGNVTGFLKSKLMNANANDLTGPNALKAKLPITKDQIDSLAKKGIKVTVVNLDDSGKEIVNQSTNNALKPSEANSDTIELKVYQDVKKKITVSFSDLIGANLATHIDVEEKNKLALQQAEQNVPKDASGSFLHRVPGLVTRQEIASGLVDIAVRDSDLTSDLFFKQIRKNASVNLQNKLDLVKEHATNFYDSIKNNTDFAAKWHEVGNRERLKLERQNIGMLADVLVSIDDYTALTFDKENKFKLLSLKKEANAGVAEASVEAEISASVKDGFCITKENGKYLFTLSKELALKAGASFSLGVGTKKEIIGDDKGFKAEAGVAGGVEAEAHAGVAVSFEFNNEEDAAVFMNNLMMHKVEKSELNNASIEGYLGGSVSASIEASASMVLGSGLKEEEGSTQSKSIEISGPAAHAFGIATDSADNNEEENSGKSVGVAAKLSLSCTAKASQSSIHDGELHGWKRHIEGTITASASFAIGDMAQNATYQKSQEKGCTLQYDVEIEAKAPKVSDTVVSAVRRENYKINFPNDLATALALEGFPQPVIETLLKSHKNNPIAEISFERHLKPGLELDLDDPKLNDRENYNTVALQIKYVDEKELSHHNFKVVEKTDTLTKQKSVNIGMSYLLDERNVKNLAQKLKHVA